MNHYSEHISGQAQYILHAMQETRPLLLPPTLPLVGPWLQIRGGLVGAGVIHEQRERNVLERHISSQSQAFPSRHGDRCRAAASAQPAEVVVVLGAGLSCTASRHTPEHCVVTG